MNRMKMQPSAFLVLIAFLAAFAGCGNEKDVLTLNKKPATIETLSPGMAGYGDTIVVTGSGFDALASSNRIVISPDRFSDPSARRVIVPFAGSRTELRGVVPDGSFTGSARVEDAEPLGSAFSFGVQPPGEVSNVLPFRARLSAGNVGKAFFSGDGYHFSVAAGGSSEDYLLILFSDAFVSDNTTRFLYNVTAETRGPFVAGAAPPPRGYGGGTKGLRAEPDMSMRSMGARERDFKKRVGERLHEVLRGAGTGVIDQGGPPVPPSGASEAQPALTVGFKVLKSTDGNILDPSNFVTVQADLKYTGAHTLLYVDNETPSAYLTDEEATAFGEVFDSGIYETDRNAFGQESDINHDGKVAILLSPAVNRLTPPGEAELQGGYIAGYFLWNDLLPHLLDAGVTNGREIFYGIVPDPDGVFGNVFSREKALPVIEGVLAHEFVHMILFNYRVLIYGQGRYSTYIEKTWLEEGLAHIGEDLNGDDSSNIKRANLFLADPGDVTLIYGGDALDERGAAFLFLRLLGDRFGDQVFRKLVQSKKSGTANVEAATGQRFKELFADWSAACYVSGRGITSDTRFNYTSIDLRGAFAPLHVIAGNVLGNQIAGTVNSMAPEFISFTVPSAAIVDFTVAGEAAGRLNAVAVRLR
jgi:hypothetical protein